MDHNERDAFKIYLIPAEFYNKISSKYLLYAISCELQILKTFQCVFLRNIQSGRSSLAKHGGAYFSAVYGFMKDPIAAPGPYENQEC